MRLAKTKKSETFIILGFFIAALLLRLINFESWFEWSGIQSSYYWAIRQLAAGHPTLVGFDAGSIGGLRFPPFQLYLLAPIFMIFRGNPLGIDAFMIILGAITSATFYLVGKKIFGKRVGIIAATIYTFSFGAITIDRKFNGSTFMIIFTLATLGYLYKLLVQKEIKKTQMVILASIIGLAFSMHYQTVFLLISVLTILLWKKKLKPISINLEIFLFTVFMWLSPLLIFDVRHNFYTTKGLLLLRGAHSGFQFAGITASAQYVVSNFLGVISKSAFPATGQLFNNLLIVLPVAFVIIFCPLIFRKGKKSDSILTLFVLFSFIGFVLLSFYQGFYNYDYYYWYLIPGFVFTLALAAERIASRKLWFILVPLAASFFVINFKYMISYRAPDSYKVLTSAVNSVLGDAKGRSSRKVSVQFYGMQSGQADYIFYLNSAEFGIKPENITLIADNDLFVERVLTAVPPPVVMLGQSEAKNILPQYIFEKKGASKSQGQLIFDSYLYRVYKLVN